MARGSVSGRGPGSEDDGAVRGSRSAGAHRIHLLNRDRTFFAREDESVLAAAERAGLTLPAGCRSGHCITCAARLLEGRIEDEEGEALSPEQEERGYVLLCVAQPRSDLVLEVGAESRRGLFRHPFRDRVRPSSSPPG